MMWRIRECSHVSSLLWNYMAHRLPEDEVERVESHLEQCASCREQAKAYEQTVEHLTAYQAEPVPRSLATWQELRQQLIASEPVPALPMKRRAPMLAWGGAALATGMALFVLGPWRGTTGGNTGRPVIQSPTLSGPAATMAGPNPTLPSIGPLGTGPLNGDPNVASGPTGIPGPDGPGVSLPAAQVTPVSNVTHNRINDHRRQQRNQAVHTPPRKLVPDKPDEDRNVDGTGANEKTTPGTFVMTPLNPNDEQEPARHYVMGGISVSPSVSPVTYRDGVEEARGW